jgi:predicted dienelactone hydrolase
MLCKLAQALDGINRIAHRHDLMRTTSLSFATLTLLVVSTVCSAQGQTERFHVGRVNRSWVDSSRRSWSASGLRPLQTTIWYPTEDSVRAVAWYRGPPRAPLFRLGASVLDAPIKATGVYPLIVLSHGTGGSAAMLGWLGERLAAAGYIVAAVDHHGNTSVEPNPAAAGFTLWWERVPDVSVVIDRILADSALAPRINRTAIGVAGFALGGYTALALAGGRTSVETWKAFCRSTARDPHDGFCDPPPEFPGLAEAFAKVRGDSTVKASLARESDSFRDVRIRAAYAIAPVGRMFTEASLREIRLPVRIVVGDADHTAPAATNGEYLAARIRGAQFWLVPGAGHYTFIADCEAAGKTTLPQLCHEAPHIDRDAIHRLVAADAERFFNRVLTHAPARAPSNDR